MLRETPLLVLILALGACSSPPKRSDPFLNLATNRGGSYGSLDLAVVFSENTRAAIRYLDETNSKLVLNPTGRFDAAGVVTGFTDALRHHFKSVTNVESLQDAARGAADLVCLLDVYAEVGMTSFAQTTVEGSCHFLRLDGSEIAAATGRGEGTVPPMGFTLKVDQAARAAHDHFRASLAGQAALRTMADAKPAAAIAGHAPPPAETLHSDVDLPSYKNPERLDRFALVIGIERYESLPQADHAERDARAVREHLLALGYPQRNVVFLAGSKAGKAGIEKYVESWLPRNVKEDSKVFVYFSGHGAPEPATGQAYLVPWDGDPQFLDHTGYPVRRLYAKLGGLKAKEVFVALDACFSGAGGRSVLPKGTRPLVLKTDAEAEIPDKVVVLTAVSAAEIAGTEEAQGHGLFTYYLLKGLNDGRGSVTVQGLYDYLLPKVQDAARRDNRDQTPQLLPFPPGGRASDRL